MPCFAVRRDGNIHTKSLLCAANIASLAVAFVIAEWKSYPLCKELGMPDAGMNFNRLSLLGLLAANYFGWQSSGAAAPDVAALANPTESDSSLAMCYHAYICGKTTRNLRGGHLLTVRVGAQVCLGA